MRKTLIFTALALASGIALAQQAPSADREAMRAERQAQAEARWSEADKDGDGNLDRIEAQAQFPRLAERFDRIDANADGEISREEMQAARAKMQEAGAGRQRMQRGQAYMQGLFKGMDDDGNGAISRAELGDKAPRLAENFAAIDTDGNGELSQEEMRAHRMQMHGERRQNRGK